ncbi:hypothetical protein E1140_02330, partial [Fulvivirga lutimaris]|nr:hypothetical protein [Fulvivirga lutimaris]
MKFYRLFFLFLMWCYTASAQIIGYEKPVKLGELVNTASEEISPILYDSGKYLYFARGFHRENKGGEYAGMDIWRSEKDSLGNWLSPTNKMRDWNDDENNAIIGVREDQQVVYLLNSYHRTDGISFSKLRNGKWIKPELIPLKWLDKKEFVGYYVSPNFDYILISMKGDDSYGNEDLYISFRDLGAQWTKPKNLGSTINTAGFEISPFLSRDKRYLFFASNGHNNGLGDADIYVSERLYGSWDVWSKPVNLGRPINSEGFDAY